MDTKLRSSHKFKVILGVVIIILATVGNFFFFPLISAKGEQEYENLKYDEDVTESLMIELMLGSYVLYYQNSSEDYPYYIKLMMEEWGSNFQQYSDYVDWFMEFKKSNGDSYVGNTTTNLSLLLEENEAIPNELYEEYKMYFVLNYDENGKLSVGSIWDSTGKEEELMKTILKCDRQIDFEATAENYRNQIVMELTENTAEENDNSDVEELVPEVSVFLQNCKIVFGISNENYEEAVRPLVNNYWNGINIYRNYGGVSLYLGTLLLLLLLAFFTTKKNHFKGKRQKYGKQLSEESFTEEIMLPDKMRGKGFRHLAEAAILGAISALAFGEEFIYLISSYANQFGVQSPLEIMFSGNIELIANMLEIFIETAVFYALWYLSVSILCPVFRLGILEYLRQYSLFYLICSRCFGFCKKFWNTTKEEIYSLDFSDKTIKTIGKIVILNYLLLAVISCFWFLGSILLIIYSVAVFIFLKKKYYMVQRDYQSLQEVASKMAAGNLEYEDSLSLGMFEPLKKELQQIRNGFAKAVEEEVKSQRMKTELITNVSHDLKTPLTAITTYVELLKNPQITEEERQSYVEILERKSLRLKVLVEDLFEISKANSNTINLELIEVDVINLLKQVYVEHQEHFEHKKLLVKWKLPQNKVFLMLDNQKTYRIFENIFANIEKYAMENSRVFVEVNTENGMEIVIKNMSAQELDITGEEITQRFVRGEASRTTEGSGLGLAIAKSFTEAQKGRFQVTVDGDLFKVSIRW